MKTFKYSIVYLPKVKITKRKKKFHYFHYKVRKYMDNILIHEYPITSFNYLNKEDAKIAAMETIKKILTTGGNGFKNSSSKQSKN